MNYCSFCRRHLNGALSCPGCGAFFEERAPLPEAAAAEERREPGDTGPVPAGRRGAGHRAGHGHHAARRRSARGRRGRPRRRGRVVGVAAVLGVTLVALGVAEVATDGSLTTPFAEDESSAAITNKPTGESPGASDGPGVTSESAEPSDAASEHRKSKKDKASGSPSSEPSKRRATATAPGTLSQPPPQPSDEPEPRPSSSKPPPPPPPPPDPEPSCTRLLWWCA